MLSALLVIAVPQSVTFNAPASRLEVLLPALGKAMGEEMAANVSVAEEVGYLRVSEVDPADLKKRIAETFHAEWKLEKGVQYLVRTPSQLAKLRADEQKLVVENIQKQQQNYRAELQKPTSAALAEGTLTKISQAIQSDSSPTQSRQRFALSQQMPGYRSALAIAAAIPAAELANLPLGEAVVYSTNPTRSERPLGDVGKQVLRQWAAESAIWKGAVAKRRFDATKLTDQNGFGMVRNELELMSRAPSRVLAKVHQTEFTGSIQLEVHLADEIGISASRSYGHFVLERQIDQTSTRGADYAPKIDVAVRPDKQTPEWKRNAADVLNRDPLSYVAQPLVDALGAPSADIVARIPDHRHFWIMQRAPVGVKGPMVLQFLEQVLQHSREGDWILVKPKTEYTAAVHRVDRKALARATQLALEGELDIWGKCQMVAAQSSQSALLGLSWLEMVTGQNTGFETWSERLLGSFTVSQRERSIRGEKILYRELNETGKQAYRALVYGPNTYLNPTDARNHDSPGWQNGVAGWATQALPNGLDPMAEVVLDVKTGDKLTVDIIDNPNMKRSFSPEQLGEHLYLSQFPSFKDEPADLNKTIWDRGETVSGRITPGRGVLAMFDINAQSRVGGPYHWKQLPKEILDRIEKARLAAPEKFKNFKLDGTF